jgi:DNA-binding response OmpR family regulator
VSASVTCKRGPFCQNPVIRDEWFADVNVTFITSGARCSKVTLKPGCCSVASTRTSPSANRIRALPPATRTVRRNATPPCPSGVWVQLLVLADGVGVEGSVGSSLLGLGVTELSVPLLPGLAVDGDGVGVVLGGTISRASAAESGTTRSGTAAKSTDRTPNQDTRTARLVATNQAPTDPRVRCIRPSSHCDSGTGATVRSMPKVLLVEDDAVVRGALVRSLTQADHVVRAVGTALDALREVTADRPDLVILDLGLPDLDGADALRMLRGLCEVPVIVATARDDEAEIVRLLNAGADDYLTKPFSGEHLAARMSAVLRRARPGGVRQSAIEVGPLRVDLARREATLDGAPLELSRREFDLLAYLAARPHRVVSRRELVEAVWRQPHIGGDQTIDVHLSWLRRKLGESAAQPRFLHTVRGVGVKLVVPR